MNIEVLGESQEVSLASPLEGFGKEGQLMGGSVSLKALVGSRERSAWRRG